jgi:hypothetical protein
MKNNNRQTRKLANFYLTVATMVRKSPMHRVTLDEIAERYDRNAAFGWLQWADAKTWFESGSSGGEMYYYLKQHLVAAPLTEIYQSIKSHYGI